MKIHTKDLKTAIMQSKKAIAKKGEPLRVLQHLKLTRSTDDLNHGIWVESTDLEVFQRILVNGEAPYGTAGYSAKLSDLEAVLKGVHDEYVHLSQEGDRLEIGADGEIAGTIEAYDIEDWPALPEPPSDGWLGVNAFHLATAYKHIGPCVSKDVTRYNLNGIQVKAHRGGLRLAATDGHRLAIHHIPDCAIESLEHEGADTPGEIIVPRKFWEALKPLFKRHYGKELQFSVGGHLMLWARMNNTTIGVRLIEGNFPNIAQVVPKETLPLKLQVSGREWERIFKNALPLLKNGAGKHHPVLIEFGSDDPDEAPHLSSGEVLPKRHVQVLDIKQGTERVKLGVNPQYLLDALQGFDGGILDIGIPEPSQRAGQEERNENVLAPILLSDSSKTGITVLMPMRA